MVAKNRHKPALTMVALFLIPIAFIVLPADFFDHGQSTCLSVLLLNQTCYGCGMTRAIQHLIHLDFEVAWAYNKLSVAVLPILMGLWGRTVLKKYSEYVSAKNKS